MQLYASKKITRKTNSRRDDQHTHVKITNVLPHTNMKHIYSNANAHNEIKKKNRQASRREHIHIPVIKEKKRTGHTTAFREPP